MLVVKRDGRSEAFDGSRIERAVLKAMREVGRGDGDSWSPPNVFFGNPAV
jgi:hypothetical protein